IRDRNVTGVQTCALPIYYRANKAPPSVATTPTAGAPQQANKKTSPPSQVFKVLNNPAAQRAKVDGKEMTHDGGHPGGASVEPPRSEERRAGKGSGERECG